MIESRRLKNIVIFLQTIFLFIIQYKVDIKYARIAILPFVQQTNKN